MKRLLGAVAFGLFAMQAAPQPAAPGVQCPHMGMGRGPGPGMMGGMGQMADVTVDNTKDGATIHLRAKNSADTSRVQQMAQMWKQCWTAPPAQAPTK